LEKKQTKQDRAQKDEKKCGAKLSSNSYSWIYSEVRIKARKKVQKKEKRRFFFDMLAVN
jgi:hypothetical protein